MQKKNSKAVSWYEKIFYSMPFRPGLKDSTFGIDAEPEWVQNVLRELVRQVVPGLPFQKMVRLSPRDVGRCIGQQRANCAAIASAREKIFGVENLAKASDLANMLQRRKNEPRFRQFLEGSAMNSLSKAGELLVKGLEVWEEMRHRFDKVTLEAFRVAWQQPNHSEAVCFFQGLAEALPKAGIVDSKAARGTTATPIYNRLFVHREEIKRLKSVRELREFLLRSGLSKQVLGDPKRLEKICERIELSFAKRGRPRKKK